MSAEFIGQISKQRLGLPRNLKFSLSQCELGSSTLTRSNIGHCQLGSCWQP